MEKVEENRMELVWNVRNKRGSKEGKMLPQTRKGTLLRCYRSLSFHLFHLALGVPMATGVHEACLNKLSLNSYLNVSAPRDRHKCLTKNNCNPSLFFWATASENESLIDRYCSNWIWLSEQSDWCLKLIIASLGWLIIPNLISASCNNLSVAIDPERFTS